MPNPQAAPQPTAMVHLYRGMMDRATTWRSRVDTPTNWAIVVSSTVSSFALGEEEHSHAAILLTILLCCGFWVIEARRYRYYDMWAGWVRLLETDYFAPMLAQNSLATNQYWHHLMTGDMVKPHFKITWREALGRRLWQNYLAIFYVLLCVWLLKLVLHPLERIAAPGSRVLLDTSLGSLPGITIISLVIIFYVGILVLALLTLRQRYGDSELLGRDEAIWKLVRPVAQPVTGEQVGALRRARQRGRRDRRGRIPED
jgi:uncharacterized membrane protein